MGYTKEKWDAIKAIKPNDPVPIEGSERYNSNRAIRRARGMTAKTLFRNKSPRAYRKPPQVAE